MELFALEGLIAHPIPTLCQGQGCPPPAQVAQGPIQPGLECLQGWGTHSLSMQSVPAPHRPVKEKNLIEIFLLLA